VCVCFFVSVCLCVSVFQHTTVLEALEREETKYFTWTRRSVCKCECYVCVSVCVCVCVFKNTIVFEVLEQREKIKYSQTRRCL